MLDGASQPDGTQCCQFGPKEYVEALSAAMSDFAPHYGDDLPELLSTALRQVTGDHRQHHAGEAVPPGPAATIAMAHISPPSAQWLVLGDAGVLVGDPPTLIVDDRLATVAPLTRERARRSGSVASRLELYEAEATARNRPGGYWVAADSLEAVEMALTGTADASRPIVLMTDGLHRHIGSGGTWIDPDTFLDEVIRSGPDRVLRRLRQEPAATRRSPDDATILLIVPEHAEPHSRTQVGATTRL